MTTFFSPSGDALAPATDGVSDEQDIVAFRYGRSGFESCRGFARFGAEAAPFQWPTSVIYAQNCAVKGAAAGPGRRSDIEARLEAPLP